MKRVSFEVAKAIKEAGYPQEKLTDEVYLTDCDKEGKLAHYQSAWFYNCAVAPTYMEVWLWLWREKKIFIESSIHSDSIKGYYFIAFIITNDLSKHIEESEPKEAIISAIEYLVENDLIK